MPGPAPKPADQRVRRNRGEGTTSTSVVLPAGGAVLLDDETPEPRSEWVEVVADEWRARWSSVSASMMQPEHVHALRRLFDLYDDIERLGEFVRAVHRVERPGWAPPEDPDEPLDPPAPHHRGGGWYELLDGSTVQGRERAEQAQVEAAEQRAVEVRNRGRWVELPGHLAFGSTGQLVESAESKILDRRMREARQLEDRFGGSPMAWFRLGWQQAAMVSEHSRAREAHALAEAAEAISRRHAEALGLDDVA